MWNRRFPHLAKSRPRDAVSRHTAEVYSALHERSGAVSMPVRIMISGLWSTRRNAAALTSEAVMLVSNAAPE
jgi:hypothetical protein